MRSLILALCVVGVCLATTGFDAIGGITTANFQCMKSHGHSYFAGRVYRSNGATDPQGIQNIKNAVAGGMTRVDGYIFPCASSGCPAPAAQVTAAVNALTAAGAKINTLWLDIEIYHWSTDLVANQNFIMAMANQATASGVNWGVYSSYNNWQSVVGLSWTKLSNKPLWWATYNNMANFNNFKAFGGWTAPTIHQYQGDVNGPCGFGIDLNWYP